MASRNFPTRLNKKRPAKNRDGRITPDTKSYKFYSADQVYVNFTGFFKADFTLIRSTSNRYVWTLPRNEATSRACEEPFFNIAVNAFPNTKSNTSEGIKSQLSSG